MKASVTIQDIALVQMQGGTVGATIEYPGFSNRRNAERAAIRDLRALATPLVSCTIYCGQEAADLDIGDAFKLEWPDYHDGALIMRITGMAFGDGRTDRIRIDCVEDVFGTPQQALLQDDGGSIWSNPSVPPAGVDNQLIAEAPYYTVLANVGSLLIDELFTQDPDVGFYVVAAERPARANTALITTDGTQEGETDFCATATIDTAVGFADTVLTVRFGNDLSSIRIGSFAQLGTEIVRVDAVSSNQITVGRGVLDTVPQEHAAGTKFFAWQDASGSNEEQYTAAEAVSVRLSSVNSAGLGPASTAMPLTFDSRAIRPYPPGNVKLNGVAYPDDLGGVDLTLTWSHRDRLQQTAETLLDTTDGNVGPESGTTYTVRLEDALGNLIEEETGITGTTWTEGITSSESDTELVVKLWAVRDGYESWQRHEIPVSRDAASSGP